jgi:hypothetical protein
MWDDSPWDHAPSDNSDSSLAIVAVGPVVDHDYSDSGVPPLIDAPTVFDNEGDSARPAVGFVGLLNQ